MLGSLCSPLRLSFSKPSHEPPALKVLNEILNDFLFAALEVFPLNRNPTFPTESTPSLDSKTKEAGCSTLEYQLASS